MIWPNVVAERIQKVLAAAGVGSRREIERWVTEGRITINGRRAAPGDQLGGHERVCLDGRTLRYTVNPGRREQSFLVYHKPGESKRDTRGEHRAELLDVPRPKRGRWIALGGVDPGTSGLILLTTDGALVDRLSRTRPAVDRQYAVRLLGELSADQQDALTNGIELEDGIAKVDEIAPAGGTGSNVWYHVRLREGRHRQLRPLFEAISVTISRVMLLRYGPVTLGPLRRGDTRELTSLEIDALYQVAGLEELPTGSSARRSRAKDSAGAEPPPRPLAKNSRRSSSPTSNRSRADRSRRRS